MSTIDTYLNNIKNARYGKEVRDSIVGGIQQCYNDNIGETPMRYANTIIYSIAPITRDGQYLKSDKAIVLIISGWDGYTKAFGDDTNGATIDLGSDIYDFIWYNATSKTLEARSTWTSENPNDVFIGRYGSYSWNERAITKEDLGNAFLYSEGPIVFDRVKGQVKIKDNNTLFVFFDKYSVHILLDKDDQEPDEHNFRVFDVGTKPYLYVNISNGELTTDTWKSNPGSEYVLLNGQGFTAGFKDTSNNFYISKTNKKRLYTYGDSITWYDGNPYNWGKENGVTARGYQSYLREEFWLSITNRGISGARMMQIGSRILADDLSNIDYVSITSGANDERYNTPLGGIAPIGSSFDTSTFYGMLQKSIEHILSMNDECKIILITPIRGWIYAPDGYEYEREEDGEITSKWADAFKEVGKLYSLPVCDWYYNSGINLLTRNVYINDPEPEDGNTLYSLHPSTKGYERMAELLKETFRNI